MESDRLRLRPLHSDDLAALSALWNDPDVRRHLWQDKDKPLDEAEVAAIIRKSMALHDRLQAGLFAVCPKDDKKIIGFGGFWQFDDDEQLRIFFGIVPEHWGLGLATELAQCLIAYGFDTLQLDSIVGATESSNVSSQRVMEKAGMKFVERIRARGSDTRYYRIDRTARE